MKICKRSLSILLTLVILLGVFSAAGLTVGADTLPYATSGKCGVDDSSNLEWFAFEDKSMVIFGNGEMRNYHLENGISTAPWYGYDTSVITNTVVATKIAVEYGVTSIGDYSFYIADSYTYGFFVQLNNIDIANTVTSIGKYAFYNQKMEEIVIPPSVMRIGENAFKRCRNLKKISYFGNPSQLVWDTDGVTDTEFSSTMTCHILKTYADRVNDFNTQFAYKHITFVADMENPYAQAGEDIDRNIALYYGAANSRVFGGASPFIIVGRFGGKKKSVTFGSNGFASCVKVGDDYYMLTDNTTGALNLATLDGTSGKATGYTTPHSGLKLFITHEYVGSNTVKVIYTLKNTGIEPVSDIMVGGASDIKIGADDHASIEPLNQEIGGNNSQVGFYMKSTKEYDKNGDDYATLGFIGKNVDVSSGVTSNATFFYGEVVANQKNSAAGAKSAVFIPERVFSKHTTASQETGEFLGTQGETKRDSGMSYYWNVDSLAANGEQKLALLFSVYGTKDAESAGTMITDLTEEFYTVTWKNDDGSVLLKSSVKNGDTPEYTGVTPYKPSTSQYEYTFSGWSPAIGSISADTENIAQYTEVPRRLFKKHSLSLDGDIGVNYYIDVTVAGVTKAEISAGTKRVKIHYTWYDKSSDFIIDSTTPYDTTEACFKAKCSVNAAEMAYDIHATAYTDNNDDNWVEYTGEHDVFSVRAYGEVVLDRNSTFSSAYSTSNPTEYDKLRNLVICMLDYGAKAQLAFDRKTNDLANNIFSKYNVTYTMTPMTAEQIGEHTGAKSNMKEGLNAIGLQYAGTSVVYLSKTSMRHYYTVTDGTAFTDAVRAGASDNFTYVPKEHGFYYEHTGIPAAELHLPQQFTIGGRTYDYSVLNYSQTVLNSSLPQADKNLAIATYWYNDAAKTYFNVQ